MLSVLNWKKKANKSKLKSKKEQCALHTDCTDEIKINVLNKTIGNANQIYLTRYETYKEIERKSIDLPIGVFALLVVLMCWAVYLFSFFSMLPVVVDDVDDDVDDFDADLFIHSFIYLILIR